MKKLILFSIMCLLLLTLVSASWEFDNVLSYEKEDLKVTFINAFNIPLLRYNLGTIELKSHSSVTETKRFGYGKEEVTMWYDFVDWNFYPNGLGEVIFTDERTGKEVDKNYYFVEWKEIDIPNYVQSCLNNDLGNGTIINSCERIQKGTKKEFQWVKYNSKDIPNRNIRIGLKTYVGRNDYIDGVWTIVGKEVSKHITWTGDLEVGLVSYWRMDESSGTLSDEQGNNTLATTGLLYSQDGATVNTITSINFTAGESIAFKSSPIGMNGDISGTMWVRADTRSNLDTFVGFITASSDNMQLFFRDPDLLELSGFDGASEEATGVYTSFMNSWTFIYWEITSSTFLIYVNNSLFANDTSVDWSGITVTNFSFGADSTNGLRDLRGGMDELSIFNRALSEEEQTYMWNDGVYCAFGDDGCDFILPIVTLNKPDNNTIFLTNEISMNCTVSDDINLVNVSLILDGVVSETNSSGINNSLYNFDKVLSLGDHNWTCRGADNESKVTTADVRFFNVTIGVLTELISPVDNQNFTTTNVSFVFNSTAIGQDLVAGNVTIWFSNGTFVLTNGSDLSGSEEVQTNLTSQISDGDFIWGASTTGTVNSDTTSNRTFTVHTTPSSVAITFPTGNIESFVVGDNLDLNWTISEPGQNLSEHITNCSFTYNSVEIFFNLTQCIEINSTTFLYVNGVNNLSFKVQEEFGFNTTNTTSWTFSVLEINQTFNNETIEGNLEDFEAKIELGGGLSISAAALIYNGTTNVGSSSTTGGVTTLTATNVLVSSVTANTNLSFVWALILSDSSQINLTIKNQTVLNLGLDNCGVFTNRIFNFTSVDEEEQTILVNTTQEIAVNIFSSDRSELVLNLSNEYTSNPTLICLNINLTNSTIYSIDVIVRYSAEDPNYAIEYFNIVNLELTNDTEEQVITLFDLNLSDSTEFQLTFTGQDFLPVENALVFIERQYIAENTFKTVELPKTDSNGQTVLHLVRNDVLYNIVVVKDNVVLGSFSNLIAFCDDFTIGDCKISLNAIGEETGVFNYDEGVGILYDTQPVYNASTFLVSFDFISSDGESKIVTLTVERRDVFGNTSICSSTVISVGGTVFCNTGNVTDTTLFTSIFVDEEEWINSQVSVDTSTYGSIGYVALFFISLLLILAFGDSKNGTIFALLIGYLIAITMGWMVGGIIGPTSSGVWIIVLTIVAIYQINKHRIT
ncbi:hypothetical protein LCGC14_0924720 [marine sediment metagenome]|uniref:LamG-like jellyroll fold domain-containing protein n=1 Tax=marine sediment metagenome TaxID=412755 RepID=A0A0F9PAG2_9ZZZZ